MAYYTKLAIHQILLNSTKMFFLHKKLSLNIFITGIFFIFNILSPIQINNYLFIVDPGNYKIILFRFNEILLIFTHYYSLLFALDLFLALHVWLSKYFAFRLWFLYKIRSVC
jgi:hypothetical protein